MDRIDKLEIRLNNLQKAFELAMINQVPITAKADSTVTLSQEIDQITPYTVTKTAYIEDTEITFTDVPDGTMSASVKDSEGNYPAYTVERTANRVIIRFAEPLTKVTTVTISIL